MGNPVRLPERLTINVPEGTRRRVAAAAAWEVMALGSWLRRAVRRALETSERLARKSRAATGGPEVTVALSQADLAALAAKLTDTEAADLVALAEELAGADLPAPAEKLTDPKAADLWPPWRRS